MVRDLDAPSKPMLKLFRTSYRAAELRPARLAVAAVGALRDLAASHAGRAALLQYRQEVVAFVLPSLEAALQLRGLHQVQQRIDRRGFESNRSRLLRMVQTSRRDLTMS